MLCGCRNQAIAGMARSYHKGYFKPLVGAGHARDKLSDMTNKNPNTLTGRINGMDYPDYSRLRPVLMTAVVVSGLTPSALLTLFMLPVLYRVLSRGKMEH